MRTYAIRITLDHATADKEVIVPVCLGPLVSIARVLNVRDRNDDRVSEWVVARTWFDGLHTRALLRRRFEH